MKAARVCVRLAGHAGPHRSADAERRRRDAQRKRYRGPAGAAARAGRREYYRAHREELLAAAKARDETLSGKAKKLLGAARYRARRDGLRFDLTAEWAERELAAAVESGCPLLGIDILMTGKGPGSPSIDKFDPARGYTQENCWIISYRANAMKRNASPDFMRRILEAAATRFAAGRAA